MQPKHRFSSLQPKTAHVHAPPFVTVRWPKIILEHFRVLVCGWFLGHRLRGPVTVYCTVQRCVVSSSIPEMVRSVLDIERAELGLSHRYSQHKVKFNVNREDNMVIQSICLLDQLDKDLNTFAMRVRYVGSSELSYLNLHQTLLKNDDTPPHTRSCR